MKTIHDQLRELLAVIQELDDKGIEVTILCKPQEITDVPDSVTESLANAYLPSIMDFYKDESNMKEFEQWKKEQEEQKKATA
ncbi:MAG: hypothetical protein RR639_03885 [Hydrogenoanaerobacterium sp.]